MLPAEPGRCSFPGRSLETSEDCNSQRDAPASGLSTGAEGTAHRPLALRVKIVWRFDLCLSHFEERNMTLVSASPEPASSH